MDQNSTALITALLAGAVAMAGYLVTQRWNRRSRRSQIFAEALRAMHDYQDYPYSVHRREADSPDVRRRLQEASYSTTSSVQYYVSILDIESPLVGEAYRALRVHSRGRRTVFVHWAWRQPILTQDSQLSSRSPFFYDFDLELDLCVRCMRAEISLVPMRSRLRRQIAAARERRRDEPAPTYALITARQTTIDQETAGYSTASPVS